MKQTNTTTDNTTATHTTSEDTVMKPKMVHGVGVNDLKDVSKTPSYNRWKAMIKRCYSEKCLAKQPAYHKKKVCPEWLTFSNFNKWYTQQTAKLASIGYDIEQLHMDSDLKLDGQQLFSYSPSTAVFLPKPLNSALARIDGNSSKASGLPAGVMRNKYGYRTKYTCRLTGQQKHTPTVPTPEQAYELRLSIKVAELELYYEQYQDLLQAQDAHFAFFNLMDAKAIQRSNIISTMVNEVS